MCGSRYWSSDAECLRVEREIRALAPAVVIHGGAHGVDHLADLAARLVGYTRAVFVADWYTHGKAAGPLRNARMLRDGKPTRGLAFGPLWRRKTGPFSPLFAAVSGAKESWRRTGTGDMVWRLLDAGIGVRWVPVVGAFAVELAEMPPPPNGGAS